jgi:SNF2 family DNA or RNA helicase
VQPGDKVSVKAHPGRIGILGNETDGPPSRRRHLVTFLDGTEDFFLLGALEKADTKPRGPYDLFKAGKYARVEDLRGAITYFRLNGKLANLIYSLNATNTKFLPYQFKPVLQLLDSPSNGLLIADEVGLGKTIEAGLIWTELRVRHDARRLLVVCPAMLREKWRLELAKRFGITGEIVDAKELLDKLREAKKRPQTEFALIASMQGIRPPARSTDPENQNQSSTGKLAQFLEETEEDPGDPPFDLVVIDEAHYLRNKATQTHRLGKLLRPICHNMVMLSATPIQLQSTDLFNLLNLLDEDAFPFPGSFEYLLRANERVVRLRDEILKADIDLAKFLEALLKIAAHPYFRENQQLQYLRDHPPTENDLHSPRGRSEIADQLDRLNPLTKVITRTLKRHVTEGQVIRNPTLLQAEMTATESAFYDAVTTAVRAYCDDLDLSVGFLLTTPQRQMSSCMAAACKGWQMRFDKNQDSLAETLYELDADELSNVSLTPDALDGTLVQQLVAISKRYGDFPSLRNQDSKFALLFESLCRYWGERPGKKVVLFSFYRNTLHYLKERLEENQIHAIVLHGGMDKQAALDQFMDASGPNILLASEVASEGIDLQFSSLLINYDLPWNPAKIEQRIGRIDRIGQEEPKILIWNLVYADTIDDRVYKRLLNRLHTFERALGSMEAVLGEQIRSLTYDLLSHKLTPEQEQARIDQTRIAIETVSLQQSQLDAEATNLLAHGEFIQNKVKAANDLGRYIRGEDLLGFIRDYFLREYPGTRLTEDAKEKFIYRIELSTAARVDLTAFVHTHRLHGRTALTTTPTPKLFFDNRLGAPVPGLERITQDHPLTRFVTSRQAASGGASTYMPVTACQLRASDLGLPKDDYVFVVARWSFSGSRDVEKLEFVAKAVKSGQLRDGDEAERLVNLAALQGKDWLSANGELDNLHAAQLQDECRAELEENFRRSRDAYRREDEDRTAQMVKTLQRHLLRKREKVTEQISRITNDGIEKRRRIIPMIQGKFKREEENIERRIAEIKLKARGSAQDTVVASGVVRLY